MAETVRRPNSRTLLDITVWRLALRTTYLRYRGGVNMVKEFWVGFGSILGQLGNMNANPLPYYCRTILPGSWLPFPLSFREKSDWESIHVRLDTLSPCSETVGPRGGGEELRAVSRGSNWSPEMVFWIGTLAGIS